MLANNLGIPETDKRKYNLDDDFLERQVEIVIGSMDCQVKVMDMREEKLNNVQYHPRLQLLEPRVGLAMAFNGCLGAQEDHYLCPLPEYRPAINFEHGLPSTRDDLYLTDTELIRKLIGHLESNHYMDPEMIRL